MQTSEIQMMSNYDDLQTGDMILCHGYNPKGLDPGIDGVIEFFTHSPWEHAAIIIRDPWWCNLPKGLYIYQSGSGPNGYKDVLNGKLCGVTLNHFDDFMANRQHIYTKKITGNTWGDAEKTAFVKAFKEAHGKPYDKNCCSWLLAGINSFFFCKCCNCGIPRTTKTFWCSALVGFMYVEMKWMKEKTDWSSLTPEDLTKATLLEPYKLSELKLIKK